MRNIAFCFIIVIIIVLVAITFIEKFEGTDYVQKNLYSTLWFYALWGGLALTASVYIIKQKLYLNKPSFLLHISLVVILIGALTTAITSRKGFIELTVGVAQNEYINIENEIVSLPFDIVLKDFNIQKHAGTAAAADYLSIVEIKEKNLEPIIFTVSMNKIGRYRGYRFYQTDFENDNCLLTINKDVYGIPITYTGYILLLISFILLLSDPKGSFRRLLKHPLLNKTVLLVLFSFPFTTQASLKTLNIEQANQYKSVQVEFRNRIMPLNTLAHDFILKLCEDTEYKGYSAEQFFLGWLLFPSEWEKEPLFEVPLSKHQRFLLLNEVSSYKQFFTDRGVYKMRHYLRNVDPKTEPALYKELLKLDEKIRLVAMLRSGAMLKIFPIETNSEIKWFSPIDSLPASVTKGQELFIKQSVDILLAAVVSGDEKSVDMVNTKIKNYQKKYAGKSLIRENKLKAEIYYNSLNITNILYRINLTWGILTLLLIILFSEKSKVLSRILWMGKVSLYHSLGFLITFIALRSYINGYISMVNGFDTMIFLALSIVLLTIIFRKKLIFITSLGLLFSGFALLVASLGLLNPQFTPLMPVLNSPLLSLHVSTIMLSYALFAFTFINALLAFTIGRGRNKHKMLETLTLFSRMLLYPALISLGIGIFIGAIWANVSWGRYWAWDPKETWALISFMIYALALHDKSLPIMRNKIFFHAYMVLGFIAILFTYFGVNFILGGMHSYVNN